MGRQHTIDPTDVSDAVDHFEYLEQNAPTHLEYRACSCGNLMRVNEDADDIWCHDCDKSIGQKVAQMYR